MKTQLIKIEEAIVQNERAVMTQLELATAKIGRFKTKVSSLRQTNAQLQNEINKLKEY